MKHVILVLGVGFASQVGPYCHGTKIPTNDSMLGSILLLDKHQLSPLFAGNAYGLLALDPSVACRLQLRQD